MNRMFVVLVVSFFAMNSFAGIEDFKSHIEMASNQHLNMNSRWKSLIQSTNYAGPEQVSEIKKFTENKEWYLRNAALVALNKMDKEVAIAEAKKLVSDKALVVRSAAVEILSQNMTADTKKIFIEEVDKNYNFNKKSSLWIRKQILESLAKVANDKDQPLFVKNLFDSDRSISELCAKTLEKMTGKKMGAGRLVDNWRQYAKQNNLYTNK